MIFRNFNFEHAIRKYNRDSLFFLIKTALNKSDIITSFIPEIKSLLISNRFIRRRGGLIKE